MIETIQKINPRSGFFDMSLDPNSIIIPDWVPSTWDATGGTLPPVVPGTPDWFVISWAGTLPAPLGDVYIGDYIIYDGTNWSLIQDPAGSMLITSPVVIADITDPNNRTLNTYTGPTTGLLQDNYYYDNVWQYFYKYDGTTLFRLSNYIPPEEVAPVKDILLDPATITPALGDRYLINGTGVGAFAGHDYEVAEYNWATWDFTAFVEWDTIYNEWDIVPNNMGLRAKSATVWNFSGDISVDPVNDIRLNATGLTPVTGDRYLINGTGTGAFAGHNYEIAEWTGAAWTFTSHVKWQSVIVNWTLTPTNFGTYIKTATAWVLEPASSAALTLTRNCRPIKGFLRYNRTLASNYVYNLLGTTIAFENEFGHNVPGFTVNFRLRPVTTNLSNWYLNYGWSGYIKCIEDTPNTITISAYDLSPIVTLKPGEKIYLRAKAISGSTNASWEYTMVNDLLISNATIISEITNPANWTGDTYTGSETGLIRDNYYYDGSHEYRFDGTTLFRINTTSGDLMTDILYADLVAAQWAKTLVPGKQYRITDYQTVHQIYGTTDINYGAIEPIIVEAISTEDLSRHAISESFPEDLLEYDYRLDICEDGITTRPGLITWRKDTTNNVECFYDWRVYKFRRFALDPNGLNVMSGNSYTWSATPPIPYYKTDIVIYIDGFVYQNVTGNSSTTNPSADSVNRVKKYNISNYWVNIFPSNMGSYTLLTTYTDRLTFSSTPANVYIGFRSTDNIFLENASNIYIGDRCEGNTFMNGVENITLESQNVYNFIAGKNNKLWYLSSYITIAITGEDNEIGNRGINILLSECNGNKIGDNNLNHIFYRADKNILGDSDDGITLLNGNDNNTFWEFCMRNTLGDGCVSNVFWDMCADNVLGAGSWCNVFADSVTNTNLGDTCTDNHFGYGANDNIIAAGCSGNRFDNDSKGNNLGTGCNNNKFGISATSNTLGIDSQNNIFRDMCSNNIIGDSFYRNDLGIQSCYNVFGNNCTANKIGTYALFNHFGDNLGYEALSGAYFGNTIGDMFQYNFIGSDAYSNTFGNNVYNNQFWATITITYTNLLGGTFAPGDIINNTGLVTAEVITDNGVDTMTIKWMKWGIFGSGGIAIANNTGVTAEFVSIAGSGISNFNYNKIETDSHYNLFGIGCSFNKLGASSISLILWLWCTFNEFGAGSQEIELWDSGNSNVFGIQNGRISIGAGATRNIFGSNNTYFRIGINAYDNVFGNNSTRNTIGDNFWYRGDLNDVGNIVGSNFNCNYIGNDANQNVFGNDVFNVIIGATITFNYSSLSGGVFNVGDIIDNGSWTTAEILSDDGVGSMTVRKIKWNGGIAGSFYVGDTITHTGITATIDSIVSAWPAGYTNNKLGNNCHYLWFDGGCTNNIFWENCNDITVYDSSNYNTFEDNCNQTVLWKDAQRNYFGKSFGVATIADGFYNNIFGKECSGFTIGSSCQNNVFGINCGSNTILGDYCMSNIFGNNCQACILGAESMNNRFGNSNQITLWEKCNKNIFGDECNTNILWYGCENNTFLNWCINNTLWQYCNSNYFKDSCDNNVLGDGCEKIIFWVNCDNNSFGVGCTINKLGDVCVNNSFWASCTLNTLGNNNSNCAFPTLSTLNKINDGIMNLAFSGINQKDRINAMQYPDAGTFTLTIMWYTSNPINWNANTATIQAEVDSLVWPDVVVSGTILDTLYLEYTGSFGRTAFTVASLDSSNLTNGWLPITPYVPEIFQVAKASGTLVLAPYDKEIYTDKTDGYMLRYMDAGNMVIANPTD